MNRLALNIPLVFCLRASLSAWIWIPTLTLFYLDRGVSLSDLLIFKTALSATALALEIPSGYLADVWGRRKTAILGCWVWILALTLFCIGTVHLHFLAAEVLLGVAVSLVSGVDSALVFDSMQATQSVGNYRKTEGRLSSVSGFAESVGGLIGALLASYDLTYPFYAQIALAVVALCCLYFVVEPPREATGVSNASAWNGILSTVSLVLYRDAKLQSLFIFYGVSGCGTLLLVWLAQGYMDAIQLPTIYFGVAWAGFHLVMGVASVVAHSIDEYWGEKNTMLLLIGITVVSFAGLAVVSHLLGLLFIVSLYFVRGLRTPLFRYYVNRAVSSDVRATVLSVQSFSIRLLYLVAGPLFAYVLKSYSISTAFALAAFCSLALLIVAYWRMHVSGLFVVPANRSNG